MSDNIRVSGWTIIRNGIRAGYPFVESILSVLDLCDEFVVMNDSVDSTEWVLTKMRRRYGKIRVINRPWPFREYRDHALAIVTQWGMDATAGEWVVHIQADEVFHQSALPRMKAILDDPIDENGRPIQAVQFHRMQLSNNFQECHGEHAVIRMAKRDAIRAAGDALSFTVRNDDYYRFDTHPKQFSLFDITRVFPANFPGKSYGQQAIWWHLPNENAAGWFGKTPKEWAIQISEWEKSGYPEIYTRTTSPFQDTLPQSMLRHIGKVGYELPDEVMD